MERRAQPLHAVAVELTDEEMRVVGDLGRLREKSAGDLVREALGFRALHGASGRPGARERVQPMAGGSAPDGEPPIAPLPVPEFAAALTPGAARLLLVRALHAGARRAGPAEVRER